MVRGSAEPRPHERAARRGGGRVAALDGYRALAIIAVFCYHLDVTWLPSGHLGVVMLLVLTGYLVTSSLLRRLKDGPTALGGFWASRIARIWPPMACMVAVVVLACIGFDHVLLTKARPDILPALGMFENVSYIVRNVSYFEQIGGPSPLTHLWYVGIDVQFCLVWPLVMVLSAILPSRRTTRRLCLVLALCSAVAMGVLFDPDAGVTRVYYGPDTRAFAPLVGAWLAYVMPVGRRPARDLRERIEGGRLGIELAALVALGALVAAMALVPDTSVILYRGGMLVASLGSAVLLATCVLPGGLISRVLALPPLAWLGSRSFGIYLWHYPLIQLLHATGNGSPWWVVAVVVVASALLAELSYRLLERPIAQGTFLSSASEQLSHGTASLRTPAGAGVLALSLVLVADGVGLAVVPEETLVPEEAIVSTGDAADQAIDLAARDAEPKDASPLPAVDTVVRAPADEVKEGLYDPVLVGDSVPGDAAAYWDATFPDGLLDSYVGRRPDQALTVLTQYLEQGVVGKVVVIQAFSNTPTTTEELDQMVAACGEGRTVYLVNVRIAGSEEAGINQSLAACAERYGNVHLIDWHGLSEGAADWLYADGEHLTPTGQPIYIGMIAQAVAPEIERLGGTVTKRADGEQIVGSGKSVVVDNTSTTTAPVAADDGAVAGADAPSDDAAATDAPASPEGTTTGDDASTT